MLICFTNNSKVQLSIKSNTRKALLKAYNNPNVLARWQHVLP